MTISEPELATHPPKISAWNRLKIFAIFVLDLILPGPLAGMLVLLVFGYYRFWGLNRDLVLILYCASVVAAALLVSLLFIFIVPPFHTIFRRVRNAAFRRMVLLLGGVIIPGLFLLAANVFLLPNGQTTITALMSVAARPAATTPADDVGNLALQTQNPSTKILSIGVLKGFRTPEALAQLVRLAREDPAALRDAATRDALAAAIASYGIEAKPALLGWFNSISSSQADAASAGGGDYYARYFSQPFDSLKNEVGSSTQDPAEKEDRLSQLAAAQQQLRAALAGLEDYPAVPANDLRLDFVFRVFNQMDLKEDADLLSIARATAASAAYPAPVRGEAFLLIGKLGSAKDLADLYPYIRSEDVFLQARALQAIAALQQKSGQSGGQ